MFCPKCGQQQAADYIKFCSRCGLPISGLGEFIAGSAVVATQPAPTAAARALKRKGVRRGAKLMFFSAVIAPLCFGLCFSVDGPGPLLIPFSVFVAGLVLMLYTQLFGEEEATGTSQPSQPATLGTTSDAAYLPPAGNLNLANTTGRKAATAEMAPPSVTEHTTRLLDEG